MLWLPVGYTLGYLVLLVVVAAPMRRSGAYTLPDFAEARLGSRAIRLVSSVLVVGIGWLYLVPQFQGASLTLTLVTGAPAWVGGFVVMVVIALAVGAGGMRSITFVQAVQYWIKLTALAVPAFVLLALWFRSGSPAPQVDPSWSIPLSPTGPDDHPDLPHGIHGARPVPRHDGAAARARALLHQPRRHRRPSHHRHGHRPARRLLPAARRSTARSAGWPTRRSRRACGSDTIVLRLPETLLPGLGGQLLTAMLAGGAFAAFLSTASGLAMSVTGVIDQELLRPAGHPVRGRRRARHPRASGWRRSSRSSSPTPSAGPPSRWAWRPRSAWRSRWRRRRSRRSSCSASGGGGSRRGGRWPGWSSAAARRPLAIGWTIATGPEGGWTGALLANPAMWATPLAIATAVLVSLATPSRIPAGTTRTMVRLHTPERVALARPASATDPTFCPIPEPSPSHHNCSLAKVNFRIGRESWDSGGCRSADGVARGHERVDAGPHVVLGVRRRSCTRIRALPLGTTGKLNAMT